MDVNSVQGITAGDNITMQTSSLLQAAAASLGSADAYVVQRVILGTDKVGGTLILDRNITKSVPQNSKIVVSPPPQTTTTTTIPIAPTTTPRIDDNIVTTTLPS